MDKLTVSTSSLEFPQVPRKTLAWPAIEKIVNINFKNCSEKVTHSDQIQTMSPAPPHSCQASQTFAPKPLFFPSLWSGQPGRSTNGSQDRQISGQEQQAWTAIGRRLGADHQDQKQPPKYKED